MSEPDLKDVKTGDLMMKSYQGVFRGDLSNGNAAAVFDWIEMFKKGYPNVAWAEMLEIRQVECNSRTLLNASKDSSKFSNESLKLFSDELLQVRGDGSFNQASEDVTAEHLLLELEPKYNDSVLDFDALNLNNYFSIEELSALEYGHVETNVDRLNSTLIQGEKTTHKLFDGESEQTNDDFSDSINNLPDIYEDYLLDAEFEKCVSDFYSVPSKEYCLGNLNLDQHSNSGLSQCGSKILDLSTSSVLVSEAKCDIESSLLDKMTTDELHVAFRNIFCRETIVVDREWLKNHILLGLQNLDALDNCLNLLECHVTSYDNKGEMAMSKQNELPVRALSPFTEVFSFKTKPRSRHMRRQRHGKRDYLKTFSVEGSKSLFSLPDLGERKSVIVTKGRMCRPAQRYMDGSTAKKLRSGRRNFEDSVAFSKDKVPRIRSKRQYYREGFRATASVHEVGKNTCEGACTQPPFGLPLDNGSSKEEGHEFEVCTDIGSLGSYVDSDMELHSAESEDFSSQDESHTITKTRKNKGRRKQHILWSLPEVSKLVNGVSEFGVGRWTDIKRVLFSSSPHRSSVDLKDKWRNLLRASCKRSHSASEAESRKKHKSLYIPPKILHRVRDLAVIFPYPREHKAKASKNVGITSKFSVQNCDNQLPLYMTV